MDSMSEMESMEDSGGGGMMKVIPGTKRKAGGQGSRGVEVGSSILPIVTYSPEFESIDHLSLIWTDVEKSQYDKDDEIDEFLSEKGGGEKVDEVGVGSEMGWLRCFSPLHVL